MLLKVKEAVSGVFLCCYWIIWGFCSGDNYFIIKMAKLQINLEAHLRDFIDDFILGIQLNK